MKDAPRPGEPQRMGYVWLKWCLLLFVIKPSYAIQCLDFSSNCICTKHIISGYKVTCPTYGDSAFIIHFGQSIVNYVVTECVNSPNWTDFPLKHALPVKDIRDIVIVRCPFPDTALHEIVNKLGNDKIMKMFTFKECTTDFQLKRYHLKDFSELEVLNLNDNVLREVPVNLFKDLTGLNQLDLINNSLVYLPPRIFDGLFQLRSIFLNSNKMTRLHPELFGNISSVEHLDISENNLDTLPVDIFKTLRNLTFLRMYANNFSSLPGNLLSYNTKLKHILLHNNEQHIKTLPNSLFRDLTELENAELSENGLLVLPEDILWGASSLDQLRMRGNYLRTLPKQIFKDLRNLRILDLSENNISDLPDGLFAVMSTLDILTLSKNHLTTISETLFSGLTSLSYLGMDENNLKSIHEHSFSSLLHLRKANFSHNQLTFNVGYEMSSLFRYCTQLETLHLGHNYITKMCDDWQSNRKLSYLNLSYNQIFSVEAENMLRMSRIAKVDLTHNRISRITLNKFELLNDSLYNGSTRIFIEENPIHCDCGLDHLLEYLSGGIRPKDFIHRTIVPGNLRCNSPVWLRGEFVPDLKPSSLPCLEDNANCNNCCPKNCTCWRIQSGQTFFVECSYRNLSRVPQRIIGPEGYHIVLNLTGNSLTEIPRVDVYGYENVTVLLLAHNNISKVDHSTLQLLRDSTSLTKLSLHENPWRCDCDAIDFVTFVRMNSTRIIETGSIKCAKNQKPLIYIEMSELCPVDVGMFVGLCVAVSLLGLFFGSLIALYYRHQHQIKVWLYARQVCLWFITEEDLDKDKLFDAFISYSHEDEDFILDELIPNLEAGPTPYKLCLHFRNWLPGDWIPVQIARSVENSRRTIVILSRNFLGSVWGRMEFKTAHRQAVSEGRIRVILVLFGDIGPTDNLDSELKAYLSTNTYVRWGDRHFWEQLRFALPHVESRTDGPQRPPGAERIVMRTGSEADCLQSFL